MITKPLQQAGGKMVTEYEAQIGFRNKRRAEISATNLDNFHRKLNKLCIVAYFIWLSTDIQYVTSFDVCFVEENSYNVACIFTERGTVPLYTKWPNKITD